jgi:hypothetical protein
LNKPIPHVLKKILTLTAIFEGATGLALITVPNLVVSLLMGTILNEPAGIVVCRIAGASLITLSVICWLYRNEDGSGILKGLLFYNTAAAVLLGVAALTGSQGLGIWPVSLLHTGLAAWCLKCLLK